jgi:hypothetical protein
MLDFTTSAVFKPAWRYIVGNFSAVCFPEQLKSIVNFKATQYPNDPQTILISLLFQNLFYFPSMRTYEKGCDTLEMEAIAAGMISIRYMIYKKNTWN